MVFTRHSPNHSDLCESNACRRLASVLVVVIAAGCPARPESLSPTPLPTASTAAAAAPLTPLSGEDWKGLHNVLRVSEAIYSGSEPDGPEGFASLAQRGIQTIVSVDGARPNLELAKQHGLRYVHIPIGYDGVPEPAAGAFARLARDELGSIYIHCHHGQHRGPAATAIVCMAAGKKTPQSARAILEAAGTGQEYAGLWRAVADYRPPPPDAPLPELVESAEVGSLTAAMANIDRQCDNLKLCRDAHWNTPEQHPDVSPAQAALLLKEGFREALRTLEEQPDARLAAGLAEAENLAAEIETALRASRPDSAGETLQRLEKSCKQCHARVRN